MPSLQEWQPYSHRVQGSAGREGNHISSQFAVICAGPPYLKQLSDVDGTASLKNFAVYPMGVVQGFSIGQNKSFSRIFEIGSDRQYFIPGRSVGQISMSRVLMHGPSLLRILYAWYDTSTDTEGYAIRSLFDTSGAPQPFGIPPFSNDSIAEPTVGPGLSLKSIKVPPGYDNFFINLASDLFAQPFGILVLLKDNQETLYGGFYVEQAVVPSHNLGFESQGLVLSESISIQYERIVPIQTGQIQTVRDVQGLGAGGFLSDVYGGFNGGGKSIG